LTPRPSGDYLARTSVFWMERSCERRHYIRSVGREVIILLAGGDKRTQDADIKLAIRLARDL
jgi:putative component of toxin-antitoxin plasmid stabilization module